MTNAFEDYIQKELEVELGKPTISCSTVHPQLRLIIQGIEARAMRMEDDNPGELTLLQEQIVSCLTTEVMGNIDKIAEIVAEVTDDEGNPVAEERLSFVITPENLDSLVISVATISLAAYEKLAWLFGEKISRESCEILLSSTHDLLNILEAHSIEVPQELLDNIGDISEMLFENLEDLDDEQ